MSLPLFGKDYCVTNSQQFQAALESAADDWTEDHHIKLSEGNYPAPAGGFHFKVAKINTLNTLKISGAWSYFFGNPCGQQYLKTPFNTVLDGNDKDRVLSIYSGDWSDVDISYLMFMSGKAPPQEETGGLLFYNHDHHANLSLNNNAFVVNNGHTAAALKVIGTNRTDIKNNLFINNQSSIGASIYVVENNVNGGVYFTNNTVLNNSSKSKNSEQATGLYIGPNGDSQILIANNLFWGNAYNDIHLTSDNYSYLLNNNYQSMLGYASVEKDNISSPPTFNTNGGFLDFTPDSNSPVIDKGFYQPVNFPTEPSFIENWHPVYTDINGQLRQLGNQLDIGANEFYNPEEN